MSFEKTLETIKTIGFDSILLLTIRNAKVVVQYERAKVHFLAFLIVTRSMSESHPKRWA